MKFCSQCGENVRYVIPDDDNRQRYVCVSCDMIHYENPKIVTGTLPIWEDKVLLCRRAIEPRHGYWTLPAGFMECDETVQDAALRETQEEANANVALGELYSVFNLPHVNQVYMMFRARLLDLDFHPGVESLETALFRFEDIPWDELAFKTIEHTLRYYVEEFANQDFKFHLGDIIRDENEILLVEHRPHTS